MDARLSTFVGLFFWQILNLFSVPISENDIQDLIFFEIDPCVIKIYPKVKYSTLF